MGDVKELSGVPGLGADDVVVIKKLGFGSLSKLRSKATVASMSAAGGNLSASLDLGKYMKWMLIFGVKSAPFFSNCRDVIEREKVVDSDVISSQTGEFILKEIQVFNNFDGVDKLKKK